VKTHINNYSTLLSMSIVIGEKAFPWEKKEWERIWLREAKPSSYGFNPYEQDIDELLRNGLVVIDKPPGPTSHQVVDYVKKILNIEKAGHSGTLDPRVTGVLPIALKKATKAIQALLLAGKEYVCLFKLHRELDKDKVLEAMASMVGEISQLPPRRSAVKRRIRKRHVYYVEILDEEDTYYLIRIGVEAGTYIRKWVHDLGLKLGVGAHMVELRRTRVGALEESRAITLQDLSDGLFFYKHLGRDELLRNKVLPVEEAVMHLPRIIVADNAIYSLCHGASLKVPGVVALEGDFSRNELVALMSLKNELIALARTEMSREELLSSEKGIVAKLERVIMNQDRYPKIIP